MKALITLANYEAFYLDQLEGNLTEEQSAELQCFLLAHPELVVDTDSFHFLENNAQLAAFEKSLLFLNNPAQPITLEHYTCALIAEQEGILTADQAKQVAKLKLKHPDLDTTPYPTLVAPKLSHPNKEQLKKQTSRIIPMRWLSIGAVAASIALIVTINSKQTVPVEKHKPEKMVANQPIRSHKKNSGKSQKKLEAIQPELIKVKSYISCSFPKPVEPVEQEHMHEKPSEEQIILPVNPIENAPTIASTQLNQQKSNSIPHAYSSENTNVLALVTSIIATKLNTPIDYKVTKPNEKEKGEIYFKIGRFEFSRKVSK
ncbi:MAG: hypothetical protein KA734_01900 [Fluviicola sp.]|nr:hypothetical protein [Fluviicola sp.]